MSETAHNNLVVDHDGTSALLSELIGVAGFVGVTNGSRIEDHRDGRAIAFGNAAGVGVVVDRDADRVPAEVVKLKFPAVMKAFRSAIVPTSWSA